MVAMVWWRWPCLTRAWMAFTLAFTGTLQGCGTSEGSGLRGLQECTGSVTLEGVMEKACEKECRLAGFNHGGWCAEQNDDRNLCECVREIVSLTKIYEEACIASPCTITYGEFTSSSGQQAVYPYTCTFGSTAYCGKGPESPDRKYLFWLQDPQAHDHRLCWLWKEGAVPTNPHFCVLPEIIPHGCEKS
mmetsp:Transcript_13834/g.25917  ORF Transcript_13834/g.25917 Transcript_13834/m.25917 type:complete len:189 (+) Transcript_13834:37-603(+)